MKDSHLSPVFNRHQRLRIEEMYREIGSDVSLVELRKKRDAGDRFDAELVECFNALEPSKVHTHRWIDGQTFVVAPDTCLHYYSEIIRSKEWNNRLFIRTSKNGKDDWSSWRGIHPLERPVIHETLPIF